MSRRKRGDDDWSPWLEESTFAFISGFAAGFGACAIVAALLAWLTGCL